MMKSSTVLKSVVVYNKMAALKPCGRVRSGEIQSISHWISVVRAFDD
jgi:hypothetical protein